MTGTSYDAFDIAAAEVDISLAGDTLELTQVGFLSVPMPDDLRAAIAGLLPPGRCTVEDVCRVDSDLGWAAGRAVAAAVRETCGDRTPDAAVWSGQTVHHWVEGDTVRGTLQLGRAAFIAEATGLPVVSDLRARDVSCGGQGAPLVSLVDALLLADQVDPSGRAVAALNLGGIGNLTVVAPDRAPLAYDVGPANALIDAAAHLASGGRSRCDLEGALAAAGTACPELMNRLLDDAYLHREPPKTTGKERYHVGYLETACEGLLVRPADLLATVTEHAAEVAAREVARHDTGRLLVAGGGVRNPVLMRALGRRLPDTEVAASDDLGLPAQAKEALAFAVLGYLTWHGLPGNLPTCTGASRAAVLGSLTPGAGPLALPAAIDVSPRRLVVLPAT